MAGGRGVTHHDRVVLGEEVELEDVAGDGVGAAVDDGKAIVGGVDGDDARGGEVEGGEEGEERAVVEGQHGCGACAWPSPNVRLYSLPARVQDRSASGRGERGGSGFYTRLRPPLAIRGTTPTCAAWQPPVARPARVSSDGRLRLVVPGTPSAPSRPRSHSATRNGSEPFAVSHRFGHRKPFVAGRAWYGGTLWHRDTHPSSVLTAATGEREGQPIPVGSFKQMGQKRGRVRR